MKSLSAVSCLSSPLLWLAAFICALYPVNEFQLELMGASIMLLLFWSYGRLSQAVKEGARVPSLWLMGPIAGLWLLSLASVFWSDIPWSSTMGFFFMGALPVTILTLSISPYSKAEWRITLGGLALIMGVLGFWAMVQAAVFTDYYKGRAVHPLRDPNSLAALFNLALIGAMGWMSTARTRVPLAGAFVLCALLIGGMIATGSRGGFFMALGGFVLIALFNRRLIMAQWRRWALLLVVMAGFMSIAPLIVEAERTTASRVASTIGLQDQQVGGDRLLIWQTAWRMVQDHWLSGTGVGTFYQYYAAYRDPAQKNTITHAHNDPLQMWAEMGIVAPIFFYGFILLAVLYTVRRLRQAKENEGREHPQTGLVFSFIALGVLVAHSHLNLNLYNLSILMLAGLGIAYWYENLNLPHRGVRIRMPRRAQAGLALVFAVPMLIYGALIASEHFLAKARDAMLQGRIDLYGHNMLIADQLGLRRNPNVYLTAVHIPLSLLTQRRADMSEDDIRKEAAQIKSNLDAVLHYNPRSAEAWYFMGVLAQSVPAAAHPENLPAPDDAFIQALALNPAHVGARIALADRAIAAQNYQGAAQWLRPALGVRLNTSAALDVYNRSLLVFSVLGDQEGLAMTGKAKRDYEKRREWTRTRQDHAPWRYLQDGTFPQAPVKVTE
jgi:O-antigen ligase